MKEKIAVAAATTATVLMLVVAVACLLILCNNCKSTRHRNSKPLNVNWYLVINITLYVQFYTETQQNGTHTRCALSNTPNWPACSHVFSMKKKREYHQMIVYNVLASIRLRFDLSRIMRADCMPHACGSIFHTCFLFHVRTNIGRRKNHRLRWL